MTMTEYPEPKVIYFILLDLKINCILVVPSRGKTDGK